MRALLIIFAILLVAGCTEDPQVPAEKIGKGEPVPKAILDHELLDVGTGEAFRLSDLSGKTVIIESFAVWCPTCAKQNKIIASVKESDPNIVSVSIDADPNEDEEAVRKYMQENGFDWRFIVSPPEFTQALMDEYGQKIVNAPSAPVILICPDGTGQLLRSGLKPPMEIRNAIRGACS